MLFSQRTTHTNHCPSGGLVLYSGVYVTCASSIRLFLSLIPNRSRNSLMTTFRKTDVVLRPWFHACNDNVLSGALTISLEAAQQWFTPVFVRLCTTHQLFWRIGYTILLISHGSVCSTSTEHHNRRHKCGEGQPPLSQPPNSCICIKILCDMSLYRLSNDISTENVPQYLLNDVVYGPSDSN